MDTFVQLVFSLSVFLSVGGTNALAAATAAREETSMPMEKYTINLDDPPRERWLPLLKDFKSSAPLIVDYFREQVRYSNLVPTTNPVFILSMWNTAESWFGLWRLLQVLSLGWS